MSSQLSVTISDKSAQYLDWLCAETSKTSGTRLSKGAVVRALIQLAMRVDIDLSAVDSEALLEQRVWEAVARRAPSG